MKYVVIILLTASMVLAQIPSPKGDISTQSLPVLQEWWRADNMGYGIAYNGGNGGMTWLENFYHGKGALVISTPTGVKTWQLRYPGDTVNVFTWQGNAPWGDYKSPNPIIKTLDINGDKVTDYIDGVGNLYYGTQNGEPPNPKPSFYGLTPVFISDINNDTYDDALSWNISSSQDSIIAYILYGAKEANNITIDSVKLPTELYSNTDRTVQPINIYKTPNGEIRIILRYRIMGKEDGYKLYGFTKTQNNYVFELKDSYIASTTNDYSYHGANTILYNKLEHKIIWVTLEKRNGKIENTDIAIYSLTENKFDRLLKTTFDSVSKIETTTQSLSNNYIEDFYIIKMRQITNTNVIFINGSQLNNKIDTLITYNTCQFSSIELFPNKLKPNSKLLIISGEYFDENCFNISEVRDTTTYISETESMILSNNIKFECKEPITQIENIIVSFNSNYDYTTNIILRNLLGKVVYTNFQEVVIGRNQIVISLQNIILPNGKYIIEFNVDKKKINKLITIE